MLLLLALYGTYSYVDKNGTFPSSFYTSINTCSSSHNFIALKYCCSGNLKRETYALLKSLFYTQLATTQRSLLLNQQCFLLILIILSLGI